MLESTWAGAPPSTCNILNHLKRLTASGLCLGWVGIGLRLFRGLSGWVGGAGGAGLHSLGSPFSLPWCLTCGNVWGREVGTARLPCPPSSSSCACTTFATSPRSTVSTSDTLFDTLLASFCINKTPSKFTLGQLDFLLCQGFHIDSRSLPTLHICQQCVDFFGSAQTFISEIASIVLQRLLSMLTNQIAAQQPWWNICTTKHCRFAQIHNIVDRIMLLTWLRFTKY